MMMALDLATVRELNFDEIHQWPRAVQLAVVVLSALAILLLGFWFDTRMQFDHLHSAEAQEVELRQTFAARQNQAANLHTDQAQLDQMRRIFSGLLTELPSTAEVPSLLEDISKQGVAAGLTFRLIKPLAEVPRQFYIELPIQISVTGTYAALATFISNVATLPRLITFHDFTISRVDAADQTNQTEKNDLRRFTMDTEPQLTMDMIANIYRYDENNLSSVLQRPSTPITAIPAIAVPSPFIYDAQNLRSPFKPLAANVHSRFRPAFNRSKEELETYPLESLQLVGQFIHNQTNWAIIKAPDDSVHYLKKGDHLGEHYGKVTTIYLDRIEIKEFIPNDEGSWEEQLTIMAMEPEKAD